MTTEIRYKNKPYKSYSAIARDLGISSALLSCRIKQNWPEDEWGKDANNGNKITFEEFLEKAHQIHGNKYNYKYFKDMKYVDMSRKAKFYCPREGHREFRRTPTEHISKKKGCQKCIHEERYKDTFKAQCKRLGFGETEYWRALKRRQAGMPESKILTKEYLRRERLINQIAVNNVTYPNLQEAIRKLKPISSAKTIARDIERGLTPEEAFSRIPNPGYANGIIYLVSNTKDDKQYVGLTVMTMKRRWDKHLEEVNDHEIDKQADSLHAAMRAFGVDSFRYEKIDRGISKDDLELKEKYWIQSLGTLTPHGYNLNSGGSSGGSNKQKVTIDGIDFESKGKADQYIARTRGISLEVAKWRRRKNKIDAKTISKPGEGICKTKLYRAWSYVIHTAVNPRSKSYAVLSVCEEWQEFQKFAQDVGEPPDDDHALVRLDKNIGYEPGNCLWMLKSDAAKLAAQYQGLMILIDDILEEVMDSE